MLTFLYWVAAVAAAIVALPVLFFILSAIGTLIVGAFLIARLPDLDLGEPDPMYETAEQKAERLAREADPTQNWPIRVAA